MTAVREILRTMDYGPAPKATTMCAPGSRANATASAISSAGRSRARRPVRRDEPGDRRTHRSRGARNGGRRRGGGRRGAQGAAGVVATLWRRTGAPSLRARPPCAEARALPGGARKRRQRQADPRIARHRRAAGRAPLLSSRRLGLADRRRVPRHAAGRRLRPDHPVELPAVDAGVEDRAGAGGGQYGGAEAGRVHAADCARLRRDLRRGRVAAGRRQHRRRRRGDRRGAGRARRASTRSPSPARPRSGARFARRPPARTRSCRSSSAASRRSSSSRTPISTARSRASSTRSGSTRARCAAPARACWRPKASPTASTPSCARA